MKYYQHSDGVRRLYPEIIPKGWEFVISPDFKQFWRKRK